MLYINPNNPVENTWLYHVERLYALVEQGGGGGGGTAEQALKRANEAYALAEQAAAAAQSAVPAHTSSEAGKILQVDSSGNLVWVNNPAWQ